MISLTKVQRDISMLEPVQPIDVPLGEAILEKLNETEMIYPGSDLQLIYELAAEHPPEGFLRCTGFALL